MILYNTFEIDDYPIDAEYTISMLERFHKANPKFRASIFAVPSAMSERDYELALQHRWIRLYPHGFDHIRGECVEMDSHKLKMLDSLSTDYRWGKVFKGPHFGISTALMLALRERGFYPAIKTLQGVDEVPEMLAYDRPGRVLATLEDEPYRHVMKHTRYVDRVAFNKKVGYGAFTSIGEKFAGEYETWLRQERFRYPFRFVDECLEPAVKRVNLGCGPNPLPGWMNLDHRPLNEKGVEMWTFPDPIPLISNRAEIVCTSHFLNYIEDYIPLFLDIWRVLRPGGVYRLEEDATDSGYCWRKVGKKHVTGRIRSEPTLEKVRTALERVGFEVSVQTPFNTQSRCREALALHTRHSRYRRNQKFILEAVKNIEIRNLSRPYLDDKRSPRRKDFPYQLLPEIAESKEETEE